MYVFVVVYFVYIIFVFLPPPNILFCFVFFRELLSGKVAPPPAARPLYEALENRGSAADQQRRLLAQGFRVG